MQSSSLRRMARYIIVSLAFVLLFVVTPLEAMRQIEGPVARQGAIAIGAR